MASTQEEAERDLNTTSQQSNRSIKAAKMLKSKLVSPERDKRSTQLAKAPKSFKTPPDKNIPPEAQLKTP